MKNGTVNRLLALGLTGIMLLSSAVGCGKEETKEPSGGDVKQSEGEAQPSGGEAESSGGDLEPVTLRWALPASELEGTKDVVEVFNKKLAELLPNTTVEFLWWGDFDSYPSNWTMSMAASEQVDLAWEGWVTPYKQDVLDGNVMEISELMKKYAPNLVKESETFEQYYAAAMYDGGLWGIPSVQPAITGGRCFVWDSVMAPYIDEDAVLALFRSLPDGVWTADVYDLIENAVQAAIDDGVLTVGDLSWHISGEIAERGAQSGYNVFMMPQGGIYLATDDDVIVTSDPESPSFQLAVQYAAKWYDMGWITDTQVLDQLPEGSNRVFDLITTNWIGADENGFKNLSADDTDDEREKRGLMMVQIENQTIGTTSFGGDSTYQVIPYTCKNPERALMLLNLLHDEVGTPGNDLYNLLCYGFEENSEEAATYGWFNYTAVEEDGQLRADNTTRGEDVSAMHTVHNWVVGNTYLVMHDGSFWTRADNKAYCLNYYEEEYPKRRRCIISDMDIDWIPVDELKSNIAAVGKEYYGMLLSGSCGSANLEAKMEEYKNRLYEVGWQDYADYFVNYVKEHASQN